MRHQQGWPGILAWPCLAIRNSPIVTPSPSANPTHYTEQGMAHELRSSTLWWSPALASWVICQPFLSLSLGPLSPFWFPPLALPLGYPGVTQVLRSS